LIAFNYNIKLGHEMSWMESNVFDTKN